MDICDKGQSTYHSIATIFATSKDNEVLHANCLKSDIALDLTDRDTSHHIVRTDRGNFTSGIQKIPRPQDQACDAFDDWFSQNIIEQTRLEPIITPIVHSAELSTRLAHDVTTIFDDTMRNIGSNDKWNQGGRLAFEDKVRSFTVRNIKIEFILPAFPCKSSNTNKVHGTSPDKGEELALRSLHRFVQDVKSTYQPGAKVWIVSDGHVFSDCIGVDDRAVDQYNQELIQLNEEIRAENSSLSDGEDNAVGFLGLSDLFFPDTEAEKPDALATLSSMTLPHLIGTELSEEAEQSRKILMRGCQGDRSALRAKVSGSDPSILALYRGFSKFMLEDLEMNKGTKGLSRSKSRKLSSRIALEMIARNNAYSNLIELLFPLHVRLSIHAHDNLGPKFGVRLLSFDNIGAVDAPLEEALLTPAGSTSDLLHIPTPWHNCVFKLEGLSRYFIGKSKLVQDCNKSGMFHGEWQEGSTGHGGYYLVTRKQPTAYSSDGSE